MKILVVTQYFYPENFRVNELVACLVKRGHKITVLTGQPNYPRGVLFEGYGYFRPCEETIFDSQVLRVPLLPRGSGSGLRLALNYLSFAFSASMAAALRLKGPFDAIFVFEVSPITVGLPAIVASRRFRAPILFWVLDLWPESVQATGAITNPRVLAWVANVVRWVYAQCGQILIQSRAFQPRIAALGFPSQRIRYFPNWVEEDYEQPNGGVTPLPRSPTDFRIVYAGNIGTAQDFPAILEAARLLAQNMPHVHWVIAGDGRKAVWLKESIGRLGLQERFSLVGQLPPSSMPGLFASADALLVSLRADPAFSLTIPGKVQSYLAAGRPVLAMLDGEGARVVEESGAGLTVASGDVAGLVAKVRVLAALTESKREEMGRRGREYAQREFGREGLFDRLDCWLAEAVAATHK